MIVDLVPDGGFEQPGGWVFTDHAARVAFQPYEGQWHASVGPPRVGEFLSGIARREFSLVPGQTVYCEAYIDTTGSPGESCSIIIDTGDLNPIGTPYESYGGYSRWTFQFVATGFTGSISFTHPSMTDPSKFIFIDAVRVWYDAEELAMRCNVPAFLGRLKTLIESIDDNIGRVHLVRDRWATESVLRSEGGIQILASGSIDDASRASMTVIRFWVLEPSVEPQPLTNGSAEYVVRVLITGFYGFEAGGAQESTLRSAVLEILDRLNTELAESGELNTGNTYLGFVDRPKMVAPIAPAEIQGIGIKGHLAQIQVTYSEEVTY